MIKVLDCTLRDGGYYNNWNFPYELVTKYLEAMSAAGVDIVELGMRSLINKGFKGAVGYTADDYLASLSIPSNLKVAVMVNASEIVGETPLQDTLRLLFPLDAAFSAVNIVRIACHVHEFEEALPAAKWLKERGFIVGFNLMQISERTEGEVISLSRLASEYEIDALYFADSMGSMTPEQCRTIIKWLKTHWKGALGIHTHDNMGLALRNTLDAIDEGVTWLDATVTGMGRGPGNARTEELVIEIAEHRGASVNLIPLMRVIRSYFQPLKNECGWGSNPYYYLSGKYGIHPTYIQEMLADARYDEEDILTVIEDLRVEGGKRFSFDTLHLARLNFGSDVKGSWAPSTMFLDREVLLIGTGPGVREHKNAIEAYIKRNKPIVAALNAQQEIDDALINVRFGCHPLRLLADAEQHNRLPQPLITPVNMLSVDLKAQLKDKELHDFGLSISEDVFEFYDTGCKAPTPLVMGYALAALSSGKAKRVLMVGFDGYPSGDPRNEEMNSVVKKYKQSQGALELIALTPSRYDIETRSIYGV
jgi:4-hydroxy 2-oxovalerate aldolase